jgi:hypothetical protein
MWFLWKKALKPSDIHHCSSANCGEKAPARSTMYNWITSDKETALLAVHEWYCNTLKQWFCEATWKLPRRQQQSII